MAVAYITCLEQYSIGDFQLHLQTHVLIVTSVSDFDNLVAPSKVIIALGPFKVLEYFRELNAAVGQSLNMMNRGMNRFPIEVCTINSLRGLNLSNNSITGIPDEVESDCSVFGERFPNALPNLPNVRRTLSVPSVAVILS